jgi:hypothetical protein
MALMMMGPRSTQTTQSLFKSQFQYQAGNTGESHSLKISMFQIGSPRPPQLGLWLTCGIGKRWGNLSDFCCQIARRKACGEIAAPLSRTVVPAQPSA